MQRKMNLGLRFFKCISTCDKMVIPVAVICEMPRVSRVVLRDVYGNIWVVGVVINGNDEWSFEEGWPHFYDDNCLEPFDFLVFEYKGGSSCVFDFKILGQNACQKKGVSNFRIQEEYAPFNDLNNDDDDYNVEYYDDDDDDYNVEYDDDDECVQEEEQVCRLKKSDIFRLGVTNNRPFFVSTLRSRKSLLYIPKNVIIEYKLKLPKRLFLVDIGGNKWETMVQERRNGQVCCTGEGWRSLCNANNINKDDTFVCEFILQACKDPSILVRVVDGTLAGRPRKRRYKRKRVSDCYGEDIFRQGLAIRPKNRQYFVSRSRPRRHELGIPTEVIKDYKLEFPDALFLVDERGNRWETKVKKWGDGRVLCSGGWRSLCNVNNIHKNDACICEFFLERDDPYILVHLVDAHI